MALVFVLWLVVLLTAIAFQMAYRGHLRARVTATTGDAAQAFFVARGGVEMAISDLVVNATSAADQAALRDESERLYKNVELGNGAYTIFAGMDGPNGARFGFVDESGKLNINSADAEMLGRLTAMESGLAEAIVALREELESFGDLNALLLIEGVDELDLYGEDQNGNGILDSNENDGPQSWPPDNGDGALDSGLAAYLTTWSAARDVDAEGRARVNLKEASAEEITAAIPDISSQQADSIVHHRDSSSLSTIMDLLNVELIEKVKNEGQDAQNPQGPGGPPQGAPNQPAPQQAQPAQVTAEQETGGQDKESGGDKKPEGNGAKPGAMTDEERAAAAEKKKQEDSQYTFKPTGKKAFDEEAFRKIADRVTLEEDDFASGRINVNTAPLEVLACLPGVDESVAQAIVNERQDRLNGYTSAIDLLDVRGIDIERLKGLIGHVCVRSDVFTVRSFGVLRNSGTFASVSAVLDRTEDTVKVLYWREHG